MTVIGYVVAGKYADGWTVEEGFDSPWPVYADRENARRDARFSQEQDDDPDALYVVAEIVLPDGAA